jgi:ABC-type transport system involved in multi-copper enzyme maturation permease subunit
MRAVRALILRQLKHHLPLLCGIALAMFCFELMMVWIAASIDVGLDFQTLLEVVLPEAMQRLVGDQFGLASFRGAVAFGFNHPMVIVATVAAVISLCTVPAGERETGLLDLVLARPVTRARYLGAHVVLLLAPVLLYPLVLVTAAAVGISIAGGPEAGAAVSGGVGPGGVGFGGTGFGGTGFGDGGPGSATPARWTEYIGPALALAPLLLVVGGYTLLFAAGSKRRGQAVTLAVSVTLGFYTFAFLTSLWPRLKGWERATIFDYYDPVGIVNGVGSATDSLVLLLLAIVLIAGAFVRFRRQQL